jgi:hypothetical protein
MTIEAGSSVTFRYRFIFHAGDVEAAKTPERFAEFAKEK